MKKAEEAPRPRAVILIDGEHYPEVVRAALVELAARYDFRGAVFLGGTEKIKSEDLEDDAQGVYGLPVILEQDFDRGLDLAVERFAPEVIVDASDEPVLSYQSRFRLVSHALARGLRYEGSDFCFTPPRMERVAAAPSLSIIGTAKRVGKTAVSGFVARTLKEVFAEREGERGVVIVPMGRGGPAEPELIEGLDRALTVADLLDRSRQGRHAASDHIEDAVLSRVTTIGCRRCGGGLAGQPLVTNLADGARLANELDPSFIVFEGSGAVVPPVHTDVRLLVAGAHQPLAYVNDYLGTYRVLISDAVILAMAEEPLAGPEDVRAITAALRDLKPGLPVVPIVFRPVPMEPVEGLRVAVFTTARPSQRAVIERRLEEEFGCRVTGISHSLSDRTALRRDLTDMGGLDPDVFLTEIKAAAIDVVAEEAERQERRVVFMDNVPEEVPPARKGELAELCLTLAREARRRFDCGF
ncbi:MAG: cyclic 2,3-diphosphoglycerate synthase [Thermoleophilia bacterium]